MLSDQGFVWQTEEANYRKSSEMKSSVLEADRHDPKGLIEEL